MTEHDKSSAVVEETRETVETTPQPETTEKTAEKKNGSNKTSLALSAIAIAIALAAGVGLYGLVKQQGANQTSTSDALVNQLTALQKAQETQKTELETVIKQQAAALAEANSKQEELAKQLGDVQQKVATISGTDAKTWLLSQADFLVKLAGRKLWSDQDHHCRRAAEKRRCEPGRHERPEPHYRTSRDHRRHRQPLRRLAGGLRRHYPQGEPTVESD